MLLFISPFMIPLAAGALAISYLRNLLFPPATPTAPVSDPYTPPFTKGQCSGIFYTIGLKIYNSSGTKIADIANYGSLLGAITATSSNIENQVGESFNGLRGSNGSILYGWRTTSPNPARVQTGEWILTPPVGYTDNCGNLPNPNPAPPIASDGLADSSPPNMANDPQLVQGSPLVVIPPIGGALAALGAAAKAAVAAAVAAANALDAAVKIAEAIGKAIDMIEKIGDWLDDKEESDKEKEKKKPDYKNLKRHDYGSIKKDGFLRLYPLGELEGFEPQYLDLKLLSIPVGYGKYFGTLSPNFYRFQSLGYISFVSPSFGNLATYEIQFSRASITIPPNAYGFFYHLGLDGSIIGNISQFYLLSPPE